MSVIAHCKCAAKIVNNCCTLLCRWKYYKFPLHIFESTHRVPSICDLKPLSSVVHNNFPHKNQQRSKMFVIGVSGVTCGGKTTLTHLLQKSFPWCQTIHQDSYFYDDDDPRHKRIEELDRVNYEVFEALDMKKMEEDVLEALNQENPKAFENANTDEFRAPNFEPSGQALVDSVKDLKFDTSKYRKVPILLLEGFTIFASDLIYEKCDARIFLSLTEEQCYERRGQRTTYIPADIPGYFEQCIWPEYVSHYESHVTTRPGILDINGAQPIQGIWKNSLEHIGTEIEKQFPHLIIS